MFKNKKELRNYLRTVEFCLKDYQETFDKHNGYKPEKFREIYDLLVYNNCIESSENIESNIYSNCRRYQYIRMEFKNKSDIRTLKTNINAMTFQSHIGAIKLMDDTLNSTEVRRFAIKLYLKRYRYINAEMKKALKRIVLSNYKVEV